MAEKITLSPHHLITRIAGIDYGNKRAGTTVIAYLNEKQVITFAASEKKQDADTIILNWAKIHQPSHIFIDAPLSLPGIYKELKNCNDYFFRAADRAIHAMSPLFLGGLTARAMQLKAKLQEINIITVEVYPGYLAKILNLDNNLYKKQKEHLPTLLPILLNALGLAISPSPDPPITTSPLTWHHFDALLALCSGFRYLNNQHLTFGAPAEGIIIV